MDQLITTITHWAGEQGIGVTLLMAAIYFLHKQNVKAAKEVKSALDSVAKERNARLDLMEQTVTTLTSRVNECEKDRSNLWSQIVDLAKQQGKNVAKIEGLQT